MRRLSDTDIAYAMARLRHGAGAKDVARELKCSPVTIYKHSIKYKVGRRKYKWVNGQLDMFR